MPVHELPGRPWPVELLDELLRVHGRFKTTFADVRLQTGLNETELMVLNAVAQAKPSATVSQIARSIGTSRQLIQKAANALRDAGLIEMLDNPGHKRASLLHMAPRGFAVKGMLDQAAVALADSLAPTIDLGELAAAIEALRKVRRALEARQRQSGKSEPAGKAG